MEATEKKHYEVLDRLNEDETVFQMIVMTDDMSGWYSDEEVAETPDELRYAIGVLESLSQEDRDALGDYHGELLKRFGDAIAIFAIYESEGGPWGLCREMYEDGVEV
jgi:hypothetical protein